MSTAINGTFSVIHSSGSTDFSKFIYSGVFCNATAAITINGESVNCVDGETIPVIVRQTGTVLSSNFLLLGNTKYEPPATGNLSGDTYTFIDIKTGNPITS